MPQEARDAIALGRTLSPGCVGSAYTVVQDAIDAAASGDVVEICAGTFYERLTISGKQITLKNASGAAVTVDATYGGKALQVIGGANATVDGITFLNGSTTGTGANVYCIGSTLELQNSTLKYGQANMGGGLGSTGCSGSAHDNVFLDGHADYAGGGAYVDGSLDLSDNTFDSNEAETNGGAAYVTGGYGDLIGNTVVGNWAGGDGGGIFVDEGAPYVDGNTFDDNDADDEGGALRVKLSSATITNNVFTSNHASYRGGAMRISHDEATLSGNTYLYNSSYRGGAVNLYESASDLSDEYYEGNTADYGGAIMIQAGWDGPTLEDCTFVDNDANLQGGAIAIDLPNETTTLRRVDFENNEGNEGGAVYAIGSIVTLESVLFDGNNGVTSGGAVYLDGVSGEITNSVAYANSSPNGSAVLIANGIAGLTLKNDAFRGNTTGSAVKVLGGTLPTVKYSDFWKNTNNFSGMANQVGLNGNLAVTPRFVNAVAGDFHLLSTSALEDAGDPALFDADGSRSDIGIYGGPYGW